MATAFETAREFDFTPTRGNESKLNHLILAVMEGRGWVWWDFAMTLIPGWHGTIFAPYFVAGAIFSGFAMVLTVLIPLRRIYGLEEVEFERYVIITTGLSREYNPAGWGIYLPSPIELGVLVARFGFFSFMILLFVKTLPVIAISEMKELAIHDRAHAQDASD